MGPTRATPSTSKPRKFQAIAVRPPPSAPTPAPTPPPPPVLPPPPDPILNFTGVATTFTIDAVGGVDTVTVNGTSAGDNINVVKGASTTVLVNGFKTVTLPSATDENVTIASGDGNDQIAISGTTANNQ